MLKGKKFDAFALPRKPLEYLTNTGLFHTGIIIIHY